MPLLNQPSSPFLNDVSVKRGHGFPSGMGKQAQRGLTTCLQQHRGWNPGSPTGRYFVSNPSFLSKFSALHILTSNSPLPSSICCHIPEKGSGSLALNEIGIKK